MSAASPAVVRGETGSHAVGQLSSLTSYEQIKAQFG